MNKLKSKVFNREVNVMDCILPPTSKRVKENTCPKVNEKIKRETVVSINACISGEKDIDRRLKKLDAEWDIERFIEINAASAVLIGTLMGTGKNKKWLAIPITVGIFLLEHAVEGWCPSLPILRKFGVRTQEEIIGEKNVLKIHRGDFSSEPLDPETMLDISEE